MTTRLKLLKHFDNGQKGLIGVVVEQPAGVFRFHPKMSGRRPSTKNWSDPVKCIPSWAEAMADEIERGTDDQIEDPTVARLRAMLHRLQNKEPIVSDARWSDQIDRARFDELDAELTDLQADIKALCRTIALITEGSRT